VALIHAYETIVALTPISQDTPTDQSADLPMGDRREDIGTTGNLSDRQLSSRIGEHLSQNRPNRVRTYERGQHRRKHLHIT